MNTWKIKPASDYLALYVEYIWALQVTEPSQQSALLLPNPSANAILSPSVDTHVYRKNGYQLEVQGGHWLSSYTEALYVDDAHPRQLLGVKFFPDGAFGLGLMQAHSTSQKIIQPLPSCFRWSDEININCPKSAAKVIESQLLSLPLIDDKRVWENVRKARLHINEEKSLDLLPMSRRTLERQFSLVTGLSLKQYEQMVRMDRLIWAIYQEKTDNIDWSDLAYRFGFSDQSYLIRQLKKAIGVTPKRYLIERHLSIDLFGDFNN
ncbi:helix-turn-helix domain-containing protein [Aliivibrio fischeri]|uniref:helix-turn-helix domain-containing protein n=1 Tax=Aliivibrio fischeri TaxID=668 RepID=UPI0012DAE293|nr:AraC family transcriptional regulator [Aliivibrio fischeri]MUJ36176.1 helix-turn-helix domain-containing protein [Aliivibrio fischeri]